MAQVRVFALHISGAQASGRGATVLHVDCLFLDPNHPIAHSDAIRNYFLSSLLREDRGSVTSFSLHQRMISQFTDLKSRGSVTIMMYCMSAAYSKGNCEHRSTPLVAPAHKAQVRHFEHALTPRFPC